MPKHLSVDNALDGNLKPLKDSDGTPCALELSTDKARVKSLEISGEAKGQTPTTGDGLATKQYVDDNAGGGGTSYWHQMISGYATNKTSTTNYYTFHRFWYENWSNADSDLSTITYIDAHSHFFIAPRAGTITNLKCQGYARDVGATDPFKFYFYKSAMADNSTAFTLTALFNTGTITPSTVNRSFSFSLDISADNSFSEDDLLFCFWKKDSNTGSQDLYFNINVNGEYS
jgi:hypothetical protein